MKDLLHILVLEDEQRAGEKLIDLIKEVQPNAIIEWKRSILEGTAYLKENTNLDLIFSDIELLDGSAFKIYESITPRCPIIFCTAYDDHFVDAFQTNGISYILKPYTKSQFQEAWMKYLRLFSQEEDSSLLHNLMNQIKSVVQTEERNYKTTFTVKKNQGVFLLRVDNIAYFQSQGDFVLAFDFSNKKHVLNYALATIENSIDPKQFFRINRSEIINLNSIVKYNAHIKNRLAITLSNPKVTLYTTNSRTPEFRNWIEQM